METICAISSAVGGAISVIRISGDKANEIAGKCWRGKVPLPKLPPRQMTLGHLNNYNATAVIDGSCIAVRMPGPNSYTGEDVVELHCHGGALCAKLAMEALLKAGAVTAPPGEFTRRAFLNGKLDLTQAEAVQDLLAAGSEAAAGISSRQLQGQLGRVVNEIYDSISAMLCEIESRLDFPEEELDFQPIPELLKSIDDNRTKIAALNLTRHCGEILRGGISMVIAGSPNVGKSSLLNLMLGQDRAIVSDIPGTTRDIIDAHISIRGIPIRIVDTAGIRESSDVIERSGMERSRSSAEIADIVLWLTDATQSINGKLKANVPDWKFRGSLICLANKIDVAEHVTLPENFIGISAITGEGLNTLYDAIENAVWQNSAPEEYEIAINTRHAALLDTADERLKACPTLLQSEEWELAAIQLKDALSDIGKITGRTVEPDLLDQIFHKFCIGK